jgi:hypothetical protein
LPFPIAPRQQEDVSAKPSLDFLLTEKNPWELSGEVMEKRLEKWFFRWLSPGKEA